jgi:hypothetical protein
VIFLAFLLVLGLAAVHLFSGGLSFLDGIPRSRWLSVAGGVSVAYVFVHLLPELAENQEIIAETVGESFAFLAFFEDHVYLVALVGLAIFYGLERAAKESRRRQPGDAAKVSTGTGVFWVHMASFSVYNAVIGYLLVHREGGFEALVFFFVAMALHFVVNDRSLREHNRPLYHKMGRWLLAGAVVVGWTVGVFTEISEAALAILIGFLAGGVILNVLKEELPEERRSRFSAFALGAAAYSTLLLAL